MEQLWLELPPISITAPGRLMVFFHGAGSSPERFAPVALAWQLKFPGATVLVMQGLLSAGDDRWDWFDSSGVAAERLGRIQLAAKTVSERVAQVQTTQGFAASETIFVGFSQGATLMLELVRQARDICGIAVSYSGKLAQPIRQEETISTHIHLLQGELDSITPAVYARQAFDGLKAIHGSVSLDVLENVAHSINQDMIIIGTTRVMQTIFRQRKLSMTKVLH